MLEWKRQGISRFTGWTTFYIVSGCALYVLTDRDVGTWAAMGEAIPLLLVAGAWLLVLLTQKEF